MNVKAEIGKKYRHYKGREYIVLAIAHHSETLEELVVYQAQYDTEDFDPKPVWVRPRAMFEDQIEVGGTLTDRFTVVD